MKGFWADHWTYTLDLVESYLKIYPDKEYFSLYLQRVPFYMSPAVVKKREDRYVMIKASFSQDTQDFVYDMHDVDFRHMLLPESDGSYMLPENFSVRIVSGVCSEDDSHDMLKSTGRLCYPIQRKLLFSKNSPWQTDRKSGKEVVVSIVAKLFLLSILKFSTLDPYGMGIEMEGLTSMHIL